MSIKGSAAPQDRDEDAAGRPWHRAHALKALADHFRTPLSTIDQTKAVSFECEARIPRRFEGRVYGTCCWNA